MSANCPTCHNEIDPYQAHSCDDPWLTPRRSSPNLVGSVSFAPSPVSRCCSPDSPCICSPLGSPSALTTAKIAPPSTLTVSDKPTRTAPPESGYSVVKSLTPHVDERGNVRETYRASWYPNVPPVKQLVRSESGPKVLRGMHLHRRQWDLWTFVAGTALVRLAYADGRNEFFDADAGSTIAIPPGVAHGFYTQHGCTLLYALTEEYTGDDEFGFSPFDGLPPLDYQQPQVRWPRSATSITVSDRDLRAPRLEDFDW